MKKGIFSGVLFFIIFIFLKSFALASQQQEKLIKPLEHEVKVELVVVEVFVKDKNGEFVDNLKKEDFEIYEDGKKVDIQYFAIIKAKDEIQKERVIQEPSEKRKSLLSRQMKLVILIDSINTNKIYLARAWPRVVDMFNTLFEKVEEVMVIELNEEKGMNVIQPFTSDKIALQKMAANLKGDLWKDIDKTFLRMQMEEFKREEMLPITERVIANPQVAGEFLEAEEKYSQKLKLVKSFSAYLNAINYIRNIEGVKSVLLISDGLCLDYKFGVGTKDLVGNQLKIFDPFGLFGDKKNLDQIEAFDNFIKLINEEKIIFYAFSPKGLRSEFSMLLPQSEDVFQEEREQWARERYTLEKIAAETGGLYFGGEKKYQNFVEELGSDLTQFYDISYKPTGKEGYHKIEVRVKSPDVIVRHRKGYSDLTEKEIEKKNVASAFLSPSFYRDINFVCLSDVVRFQDENYRFWIRVRIPLSQFQSSFEIPPDKISILFGIVSPEEDKIQQGEAKIKIRKAIEDGLDRIECAFLTSAMQLKPKDYELRVILKGEVNKIGGWEKLITIPDRKKSPECFLLNCILGKIIREKKENPSPFSVSPQNGSLLLSRYTFYPSADNTFMGNTRLGLFLQIFTSKDRSTPPLEFYLVENGKEGLSLAAQKVESFYDKKTGILSDVYLLTLPAIPPGNYKVTIKAPDGLTKTMDLKIVSETL